MNENAKPEHTSSESSQRSGAHLGGFVDAASALVLVASALYFWGYVYLAGYTEHVGARFHGISLPVQDYLIISWQAVFYMLLFVAGGLFIFKILDEVLEKFANWIVARRRKVRPKAQTRRVGFSHFEVGLGIVVAAGTLLVGAQLTLGHATRDADSVLKAAQDVIIFDSSGSAVPGRFQYLRDFGSTLMVQELSQDGTTAVGIRFFKEGSYSGFTLTRNSSAPILAPAKATNTAK